MHRILLVILLVMTQWDCICIFRWGVGVSLAGSPRATRLHEARGEANAPERRGRGVREQAEPRERTGCRFGQVQFGSSRA